MSLENLKKYGKLCEEKEEVREKAKEIGLQDLEGQIAYGKSLGLDFSKEDFEALAKEAGVEVKKELSEEELEKVAGGLVTSTVAAFCAAASLALSAASIGGQAASKTW
jgi:predicted ribosomally synthesized peptide with nif11-like leader